jgi:hypothetical protein
MLPRSDIINFWNNIWKHTKDILKATISEKNLLDHTVSMQRNTEEKAISVGSGHWVKSEC